MGLRHIYPFRNIVLCCSLNPVANILRVERVDTKTKTDAGKSLERTVPVTRKRNMVKYWTLSCAVLIVAGTGWFFRSSNSGAVAAESPPPLSVKVSKPSVQNLDTRLGFLGQFAAVDQVDLRAQVGGTLTGIYFKDGATVHKGDLLFTIDSRPYEIRLDQAKAQLEAASGRLVLANLQSTRARELQRNDAGTVQNVEQRSSDLQAAQGAVDDAKAQIRDAQFDLEHCRISAPFSGRIGAHQVSIGNLVAGSRAATSPTTLLATIVSLDPIYLNFDMSESDYQTFGRYRNGTGNTAAAAVDVALGDEKSFGRHGELDFINNVLDRSSGTIRGRATIKNPDLLLTPGEFARLRLVVASPAPTLLLPDSAVMPDQSEHMVMTVSPGGIVTPKRVEIGGIRGGLRVIRSGLSADDEVIVDGLPYVAPGAKVTAQEGTIHYAANQE